MDESELDLYQLCIDYIELQRWRDARRAEREEPDTGSEEECE
jgi:hypothetical protein